jgi:hypothetical protein
MCQKVALLNALVPDNESEKIRWVHENCMRNVRLEVSIDGRYRWLLLAKVSKHSKDD